MRGTSEQDYSNMHFNTLTVVANSIDEPTFNQIASKRGAQSKILRLMWLPLQDTVLKNGIV